MTPTRPFLRALVCASAPALAAPALAAPTLEAPATALAESNIPVKVSGSTNPRDFLSVVPNEAH